MNRDFLEELKCLFLRVRNPKKSTFEDLVRQIFNCDLNSAEGIDLLRIANRQFGDFRNKFLDSIEDLINEFKAKRVARYSKQFLLSNLIILYLLFLVILLYLQ